MNPIGNRYPAISAVERCVPRTRLARSVRTVTVFTANSSGRTSSNDSTSSDGHVSWMISTIRDTAAMIASGSVPRSKRALASERSLSRFDVLAIHMGVQWATSSSRFSVSSPTSLVRPPMTAAIPTAIALPSAMIPSSTPSVEGESVRSTPSSVVINSSARAQRTSIQPPGSRSRSNAWLGMPYSNIT